MIIAQKKEAKAVDNSLIMLQRQRNKDISSYGLLQVDKYAKIFEIYPSTKYEVYLNEIKAGLIKNSKNQSVTYKNSEIQTNEM